MNLSSKTAIITGASSGIGRTSALLFAREGAKLVLGARRQDALDDLAGAIRKEGGTAVTIAGDVRDEAYAKALVDGALSEFGGLDIAFNNAGVLGSLVDAPSTSLEEWKTTLDINLTGAFLGAKHQIPALLNSKGGSLIFTASFVGHSVGMPGMSAYAASKAGLVGMVQCLAAEHGAAGLRVNALLPGGTRTPMADAFAGDDDARAAVASFHALKRMAAPEEIARAALFLASEASSFVTGSAMVVDGGNSISKV